MFIVMKKAAWRLHKPQTKLERYDRYGSENHFCAGLVSLLRYQVTGPHTVK